MPNRLDVVWSRVKETRTAAFVGFITAGYPEPEDTVPLLRALEAAGTDIIELGVPYSDPQADGASIQHANEVALAKGMSVAKCLGLVREAREAGVAAPIILMGYYNPILAYGLAKFATDAAAAGVDGLIIVDLPPEMATQLLAECAAHGLSFVPLATPASTDDRLTTLAGVATSFVYCVSLTGVTGERSKPSEQLPDLLARMRARTPLPLAVGFGISSADHVRQIVQLGADAVVVGSAIVKAATPAGEGDTAEQRAARVGELVKGLRAGLTGVAIPEHGPVAPAAPLAPAATADYWFGEFGGRFIPETLIAAHDELASAYAKLRVDADFQRELHQYRTGYIGGPTPLYYAANLTKHAGGAHIWLKREELAHTGAHKINNAIGQALIAKRLGKTRIIAETGAGQHGVATATACALLGLKCVVYMGMEDCRRQALNVFRMKILGAEVVPVESGSKTLKDAINEAMRDWVTNVKDTHYIIGSAVGSHPFPLIVRDFQSVIGREARQQFLEQNGRLPEYVLACVGGGSNAIGMFHPFVQDAEVRLVGIEAGGEQGAGTGLKHCATLSAGTKGVLHGAYSYLLQDADGQCADTHSISAGLDYPGVGPEHAWLKETGRCQYVAVTDSQALEALQTLSRTEGIIPALESSHAVYHSITLAKSLPADQHVLVCLSGRGDKDMITVARVMGVPVDSLVK